MTGETEFYFVFSRRIRSKLSSGNHFSSVLLFGSLRIVTSLPAPRRDLLLLFRAQCDTFSSSGSAAASESGWKLV